MDRRNFVKGCLGGVGGAWAHSGLRGLTKTLAAPEAETSATKFKVPYVRETIPDFQVPAYRGRLYDDTVPDTLDLAERSRLAAHAMTSIVDPQADDEVYWLADFYRNPPGENGPMYRREYFNGNRAPMRKVRRFVTQESIVW